MPKQEIKHDVSLEQLQAKYKVVYTITGMVDGKELVGYYRNPDYETRKVVFQIAYKDQSNLAGIGEVILNKCFIGGDNLWANEEARFEAVLQAASIVEFNDSFKIKKN